MTGGVTRNPLARITSNKRLIHLALVAAVAVGIVGATYISSSKPSDASLSLTLRRVSAIIFLVVTALLAIQTVFVVREEHALHSKPLLSSLSICRLETKHFTPHAQDAVRYNTGPLERRTEHTSSA